MILALALALGQNADPFAGEWAGTSLCLVRPSPCTDEQVVYRIRATGGDGYRIDMDKLVAGVTEPMGVLDGHYDPSAHRFVAITRDRSGRTGQWIFALHGAALHGQLVMQGDRPYRSIEVIRKP